MHTIDLDMNLNTAWLRHRLADLKVACAGVYNKPKKDGSAPPTTHIAFDAMPNELELASLQQLMMEIGGRDVVSQMNRSLAASNPTALATPSHPRT